MPLYGALPNFNAQQRISAEGHLNAIQRYITLLHDDVAGVSVPGMSSAESYIRHVWDTLAYSITRNSGTITIKYDSTTIATFTTGTNLSGTIPLSSYGFTVNQFYKITVTGNATVLYLREQNTASYPTLASFANNTTPTAAQWQALNTYSVALTDNMDVPLPLNTRLSGEANFNVHLPMIHRGRNLVFAFRVSAPYQCSGGGGHTRVQLVAGGVSLFDTTYSSASTVDTTLNLSSLMPSLAIGASYRINLIVTQTDCEFDGSFRLYRLYEYPSAEDSAPGWSAFPKWVHGQYIWGNVNGAGGVVRVVNIKNNLESLGPIVTGMVYPAPKRAVADNNAFLYGVRRRRFLHYLTMTGESCSVNWMYQGEAQQITLPTSATSFMVVDLDSLNGLTPGVHYWVGGTAYAMEDSHV